MALDGGKPITKAGEGPENRDSLETNIDMFSAQETPLVHKILIPPSMSPWLTDQVNMH